jgi:MFS family permease
MKPRVLADRNLRVLLAGQTMNMFGNTAMIIVLGIWVKDLTGSSGAAGLIFLLLAISSFLAPATGLLVDRFPRRWVLLINDVLTGIAVAALVLVHGRDDVWLIYLIAVGYGISGQIYRAARGGLLHSMVPGELLGDANGLFTSLGQGMRIIGPAAGAGLYAAWGGGVVAVADTGTFFFSAASYLLIRNAPDLARPAPAEAGQQGRRSAFLREMAAGARHVAANPVIRRMVLASAVAFTGAGMIDVAMFSLVDQGLHRPTAIIGVLASIQGAGSVVSGVFVGRLLRWLGEYSIATIGFLLNGFGLAAASTTTLAGVVVGYVAIGLGLPMIVVAEITLVQRRTPGDLQGRAIAASEAFIDFPFALSIGVGAAVIGVTGFRPIFIGVAAGFALVGFALLPYRSVTRPDPDPATAAKPAADRATAGQATAGQPPAGRAIESQAGDGQAGDAQVVNGQVVNAQAVDHRAAGDQAPAGTVLAD